MLLLSLPLLVVNLPLRLSLRLIHLSLLTFRLMLTISFLRRVGGKLRRTGEPETTPLAEFETRAPKLLAKVLGS